MKFDILHSLRGHLNENYNKNTANNYYFAVKNLFAGIDFNDPREIPLDEIEQRMLKLKSKREFSAAKRGLMELQSCFPGMQIPDNSFFTDGSKHKRNFKKRRFEPIKLDTVKRKINVIRDKKLKLAYRLMLASGARVSEVFALNPEDITIDGDNIQLNIINGKGGKDRTVTALNDAYLARELARHIETLEPDQSLFYSAGHMINKAGELGLECHDLRRAFSKAYLRKQRQEAPDAYTANGNLMAAMGHGKWRTTKRYLRRKIEM